MMFSRGKKAGKTIALIIRLLRPRVNCSPHRKDMHAPRFRHKPCPAAARQRPGRADP